VCRVTDRLTHRVKIEPTSQAVAEVHLVSIRLTQAVSGSRSRNITDQYQDRFFVALLNGSPNPILVLDANAAIQYVNSEFETQTGYHFNEVVGMKPPYPWWTEDTEARFYRLMEENKTAGSPRRVSDDRHLFRKKDGSHFWVELLTSRVIDDNDTLYFMTTWMDITRRVEEEETARTLINSASNLAILIDLDYRILAINRVGAGWFGGAADEISDRDYFQMIPPELKHLWQQQIAKTLKSSRRVNFDSDYKGVHYANSICPVFNTQHEIFRLAIFAQDITLRKHTETKVRSAFKELMSAVRVSIPNPERSLTSTLTSREESVVQLLAEGKNTKEISLVLDLSIKTIETHRSRVMNKLGIHSIAELTKFAIREGLSQL
jgi:PAS domain S-box-containing protein